jgi:hypothetical protein
LPAGLATSLVAALLGGPSSFSLGRIVKPGLELLSEVVGDGAAVERHEFYRLAIRMWLRRGDPVVWSHPWGNIAAAELRDEGTLLVTDLRVDREYMFAGLFYGVHGMRIGGTRTLCVAPHLAYGDAGVPGTIPPNALLTVEVHVLSKSYDRAINHGDENAA